MSRILPVLLALIIVISSCKTDPKTDDSTNKIGNNPANELVMRINGEPDRLNPFLSTSNHASQINDQIFQSLLNLNPVTLELIPQLIVRRPIIEEVDDGEFAGGMKYTYEFQPDAVWDDGKSITAEDYIFGIKVIMIPTLKTQRFRPYLQIIKKIEVDADNPRVFYVYTAERLINGEEFISSTIPVLPAHLYDTKGHLSSIPLSDFLDTEKIEGLAKKNNDIIQFVQSFNAAKYSRSPEKISGSGPYKLIKWKSGENIVLEKKENWWGDKLADKFSALEAHPRKLTYINTMEGAVVSSLIRSGEVDVVGDVPVAVFEELKKDEEVNKKYNFHVSTSLGLYSITLNTTDPLLSDKRVRRAFANAIDVDEIIEVIMGDYGERATSPVHPSKSIHDKSLKKIEFDSGKARELLAEAGWTDSNNNGIVDKVVDGELRDLIIPVQITNKSSTQSKMMLLVQQTAKQAGIKVEIVALDFNLMKENLNNHNYLAAVTGKSLSPLSWNPKQAWKTTEGVNRTGFGTRETDALIDKIMVTMDENERSELYGDLQKIIYDEQPEIFLFVLRARTIIHKRFDSPIVIQPPGFLPNYFKLNGKVGLID